MAQDKYADLVGIKIGLHDIKGPLQPCRYCGNRSASIGKGTGPHHAETRCDGCGSHLSWLSAQHLDAIAATHKKGAA